MKLSTKGRYATRAMIELAMRSEPGPIQLKGVADAQDVSAKYLERLFQMLKQADILRSIRGVHGGYVLAKSPEQITILEIVEAVEGKLSIVDCVINSDDCQRSPECVTRNLWSHVNNIMVDFLGTITLADLVSQAQCIEINEDLKKKDKCLANFVESQEN
jgi:Rrf2 family protein